MRWAAGQHVAAMRGAAGRRRQAHLATVGDDDRLRGGAAAGADGLDGLDDLHALGDLAEDAVLAVEEGRVARADEELRSVP